MSQARQFRGWIGALAPALLLVAGAALAAPTITGYGSAEFGMSPDEVRERLIEDGVTDVSEEQQRDRFVRLWTFEEYLTVEYLDNRRLSGQP